MIKFKGLVSTLPCRKSVCSIFLLSDVEIKIIVKNAPLINFLIIFLLSVGPLLPFEGILSVLMSPG